MLSSIMPTYTHFKLKQIVSLMDNVTDHFYINQQLDHICELTPVEWDWQSVDCEVFKAVQLRPEFSEVLTIEFNLYRALNSPEANYWNWNAEFGFRTGLRITQFDQWPDKTKAQLYVLWLTETGIQ